VKKIFNEKHLEELRAYHNEVIDVVEGIVTTLDESYGTRHTEDEVDKELGGYVLIVEKLEEINEIEILILKGVTDEYTDIIECSEGVTYTSSLFLISDDYAVITIVSAKIFEILL